MKTLLLNLLSLHLVFMGSEVYGALPQSEGTPLRRSASMLELNSLGQLTVKDRPVIDKSVLESQNADVEKIHNNMVALKNKFDSIEKNGITEIDISYPSFLNFIRRKSPTISIQKPSEISQLHGYIVELINSNMINNANDYFDILFTIGNPLTGQLYTYVNPSEQESPQVHSENLKSLAGEFKGIFKELISNYTFQQRIKTLLILRKITELNLSENFGIEKLSTIGLIKNNGNESDGTSKLSDGIYRVSISNDQVMNMQTDLGYHTVMKAKTPHPDPLPEKNWNSAVLFLHELTHIYHMIIGDPVAYPVKELSWDFDDVIRLLNPWCCEEPQKRAKELLKKYCDKEVDGEFFASYETNSEEFVQKVIDGYKKNWGDGWSNLEEVLTIIGVAPVDFRYNGMIRRYRVFDRQNQSSEMNRAAMIYRLLHSTVNLSWFEAQVFPDKLSKIHPLMLQALIESGYNLYLNGPDIAQNSTAMEKAEREFLGLSSPTATLTQ